MSFWYSKVSHQWCNLPGSFKIKFLHGGDPIIVDQTLILLPAADICNLSLHFFLLQYNMATWWICNFTCFDYDITNQWHSSFVKPLSINKYSASQFEFWYFFFIWINTRSGWLFFFPVDGGYILIILLSKTCLLRYYKKVFFKSFNNKVLIYNLTAT